MLVLIEVDIAADGTITPSPKPARVATGERLMFHVNTNASDAAKLTVHFPGGPRSPFGAMSTTIDMTAHHCSGGGTLVRWPEGVHRATVMLSAHGSPEVGRTEVEVLQKEAQDRGDEEPAPPRRAASSQVVPCGPATDQAYTVTISDPKITAESAIGFDFDPASDCVKVCSNAVTDGEAVVVLMCVKVDGRCKACTTTVGISVLEKDATVIAKKRVTIHCIS
jgi:hypothetical protein